MEIYVHVPFCVSKCRYCDFYSGPASGTQVKDYIETLLREIDECIFTDEKITSVFIGGGTPTFLESGDIGKIFDALHRKFTFQSDTEITMEANPGTLTKEKLRDYQNFGVDRLSIGLQSTNDAALRMLGRIHTFSEFRESFLAAREIGFDNINIDLLSGLPGETGESFLSELETVLTFRPEHLSVYDIIPEPGTPFYEDLKSGRISLPEEAEDRAIYRATKAFLEKQGYVRYEISNYAIPGKECRHNLGYWTLENYIGFGSSAASYVDGKRFQNRPSLSYLSEPYIETEMLTEKEKMSEFMILALRLSSGASDREFQKRFGKSFFTLYEEAIGKAIAEKTLEKRSDRIFLTDLGFDLANRVMAEFI